MGPLWLLGCDEPPTPTCAVEGPHLLVASTDYQSGVLGAVALDGSCLAEPLASAGTDPLLRVLGDRVGYADASDGDAVRLYVPGDYAEPEVEFALRAGGNTHDVVRVGDELLFARYDDPFVTVTALDGTPRGRIDLAADADADGLPEADRFAFVGERLFLALQRLDRGAGFAPSGPGRVVELDPVARRVVARHDTGPNPKLWPGADGTLLVSSGVFFALDGEVTRLDPDGASTVLATESELGFDVTLARESRGTLVLLGLDPDESAPSHLRCGARHERVDDWPRDAVVDDEGIVWGISRPMDWAGTGRSTAWALDPAACVRDVVAEGFLLGPASVALPAD
jgi:hypothetical protein